ncbi:ShlB/FhaC/HecB family hemolysin secretion/activation protein [Tsuneonella sp. YG55]|uniref:ShlB/FhaC/HecB family hemolysin secretion/activation protein n=1 Tax=Tsuneonella litorea TaxID=2976475 RepID=A0A9X2VY65_9SPHN|nr:ShlB/FhaC/HecB family hemolysin secretion/activation protein [Tsuneonella litorea]MCT2557465.1 ShlB/FhaC/HecB family hemolysin secretion/activation protein [Tsuneonella litorea]
MTTKVTDARPAGRPPCDEERGMEASARSRARARRAKGIGPALGTALVLFPALASAQVTAPSRDDLSVGRDAPPPASRLSVEDGIERGPCPLAEPAFAGGMVTFSSVEFTGLPGVPPGELAPSWQRYAGREVPITALCDVRDRAATELRRQGFLAAVQIPPQRIEKNGTVRMDVLAARLVELQVRGDAGGAEKLIEEHLEPLTGEPYFNTRDAERNLLLLRDLPGYDARLTLRSAQRAPGEVIGDIVVDRVPVELVVGAQNMGSRATGREGLFAEIAFNGLLGLGDRTTASIYNTVQLDEQRIIRLGHELALGAGGLRAGGSVLFGRSEPDIAGGGFLSRTFAAGVYLRGVLARRQANSAFLTGGIEKVDQELTFGGVQLSNDELAIAYARLDHVALDPASLSGTGGYTPGDPRWRALSTLELRKGLGILGASTGCATVANCLPPNIPISNTLADPRSLVVRFEGQYEYRPVPRVTLAMAPLAQWCDGPLLAYEQASLGNYTIGRGLDPGVALGDRVLGSSFELRFGSRVPRGDLSLAIEPFAFVDWARAWLDDGGVNPDPRGVLTAGAGVRGRWKDRFDFGLTFAAPLRRAGYQTERSDPRLLFTLTARLLPWGDF